MLHAVRYDPLFDRPAELRRQASLHRLARGCSGSWTGGRHRPRPSVRRP